MARSKNFGWMKDASCQDSDPSIFLSYSLEDILKAKNICKECSVQKPCKAAFDDVHCVAGGLTLLERLKAKRKRVESLDDIKWR